VQPATSSNEQTVFLLSGFVGGIVGLLTAGIVAVLTVE
jgi:hypothetical protein